MASLLAAFVLLLCFASGYNSIEISNVKVEEAANAMAEVLVHHLMEVVRLDYLEETLSKQRYLLVEPVNRSAIFEELYAEMKSFFARASERIDRLASAAQQSCLEKCDSPPIHEILTVQSPIHPYWHATELLINPELLRNLEDISLPFNKSIFFETFRSARFLNRPINITASVVHTPTDIYYRSLEVMNVVHWTEDLDHVFTEVYESAPEITWQYFCTANSGVMRVFPGTPWPRTFDGLADTYDCRQTHWYLKASSSPKDALIILDSSGSMKGTRTRISAFAAYSLLETFTSDDYVNIALLQNGLQFLEGAELVSNTNPVYNSSNQTVSLQPVYNLIQATDANKKRLEDKVNARYSPKFIANFSSGLNAAFNFLNSSSNSSSHCNKLLMIVSDGLTETYHALYEKFKASDIRIFSLLVDLHKDWRNSTMEASCATKGAYIHVPTLSSTLRLPYEYIRVLSRPLSFSVWKGDAHHPTPVSPSDMTVWSSTHFTSFLGGSTIQTVLYNAGVDHNCHGLPEHYISDQALVLTVAQPVFNGTNSSVDGVTMLGVVAIDIPIHAVKSIAPVWRTGWGTYIFLIDNNGFVSIHPQYAPIDKNASKPAYRDTELSDLEQAIEHDAEHNTYVTNVFNPLRHKIIMEENGKVDMEVLATDYKQKVQILHREYHYRSFSTNDFTFGTSFTERPNADFTVVPTYELYEIDMLNCLNQSKVASTTFDIEELFYNCANTSALIDDVDAGWNISFSRWDCKQEYLDRVFADVCSTTFLKNSALLYPESDSIPSKPMAKYLVTYTGLTRIMSIADIDAHDWEEIDALADKKNVRSSTANEIHHILELVPKLRDQEVERLISSNLSHSVTVVHKKIKNDSYILTMSKVILRKDGNAAVYAVAGAIWSHSEFVRSILNINMPFDCGSENFQCFVLDDNAVLLYSSHPNDTVGEQFSQVFTALMNELVKRVYIRVDVSDHQRICESRIPPPIWAAGAKVVSFLSVLLRAIFTFVMSLGNLMYEFAYLTCHTLTHLGVEAQKRRRGPARGGAKEAMAKKRCTRVNTMFTLNANFNETVNGSLEDNAMWWASKIHHTNLVLVVLNGTIERNASSTEAPSTEELDDDAPTAHDESAQPQVQQSAEPVSHEPTFFRDKEVAALSSIEEQINKVRRRPRRQCFGDIHAEEEKLACEVNAATITSSSVAMMSVMLCVSSIFLVAFN